MPTPFPQLEPEQEHKIVETFDSSADLGGRSFDEEDEPISEEMFKAMQQELNVCSIELPPQLAAGVELARNSIIQTRNELGRPFEEPNPELHVAMLPNRLFYSLYFTLAGIDIDPDHYDEYNLIVGGFFAKRFDAVVIPEETDSPQYIRAASVLHEFMHEYLELRAYTRMPDQSIQDRRHGFVVDIAKKNPEDSDTPSMAGDLLNELSVHMYEANFTQQLLAKEEFKEENRDREKHLTELMGSRESLGFDVSLKDDPNLQDVRIYFSRDNLHFDLEGNHNVGTVSGVITQIGRELEWAIGNIDGVPFSQYLLETKINPRGRMSRLKKKVDNVFGKGFFRKLRERRQDFSDAVSLLNEIQQTTLHESPNR